MFEPFFENLPGNIRAKFEKIFHGYKIHSTAKISRGVKIIYNNKKLKGSLVIGENSFIGVNSVIDLTSSVFIGKNVQIAPNVLILTHDSKNIKKVIELPVKIEDNVYIGSGAIILPGVTISKNAVVGAGAVVTKNVLENNVVAGIPAKPIKNSGFK
jgi:maltose O-acetyltransferase